MTILGHMKVAEPYPRDYLPKRKALPKLLRQRVFDKCGGRCGYCGDLLNSRWCADHMRAHYLGGQDDLENLMPACFPCNNLKHSYSVQQFRQQIADQVNRARSYSVNFRTAERFGMIEVKSENIVFYFERLSNTIPATPEKSR